MNVVEGLAGNDLTSMYDSAVETMSGASVSISSQSDDVSAAVSDSYDKSYPVHEQYLPPEPPADSSPVIASTTDCHLNVDVTSSVRYLSTEPSSVYTDEVPVRSDVDMVGSTNGKSLFQLFEIIES
jgi:hypothetical protein